MSSLAAIVRAIRSATDEGEEFDLAGAFTEQMARDLIKQGFSDALPATKPLKFTLIVGGGKLVRSRYDVDLTKWLTAELRALGYDDDRGASLGSEGAFKRQHDTDQNLEYLHIFPRLARSAGGGGSGGGGASGAPDAAAAAAAAALDTTSPDYVCVACSLEQLQRLVATRVAPYAGRKRLQQALQEWDARLEGWDAAMTATARPLAPGEQAAYDVTTREALGEKLAWLAGEMKAQVAAGRLTAAEKDRVLAGMDEKLAAARAELAGALAVGAPASAKRATALAAGVEALAARRSALAACVPLVHPLRGDAEMRKCEITIANGERLKAKIAKEGRLATLAEARELGGKLDAEAALRELQSAARTWFESDDEFKARFAAAMRALQARQAGGARR